MYMHLMVCACCPSSLRGKVLHRRLKLGLAAKTRDAFLSLLYFSHSAVFWVYFYFYSFFLSSCSLFLHLSLLHSFLFISISCFLSLSILPSFHPSFLPPSLPFFFLSFLPFHSLIHASTNVNKSGPKSTQLHGRKHSGKVY